ncbi:MAG: hypothetical protein IIB58_01220 [Planctomycetes bacterium]|nr:hypothetical protein [Planctomycetota bacterium]
MTVCGIVVATGAVLACGCTDRRGQQVRDYVPASNDVVTSHGMTLDENATPEQVVWVLLSAIREDVRTKVNSPDWKDLMKLQCRLANVELLRSRADAAGRSQYLDSDSLFFSIVRGWAPALNCYTESFDDEFEAAKARMTSKPINDPRLPEKYHPIQVVNYVLPAVESDGSACLNGGVNIQFALSKTQNGYWRVYAVSPGPPPAPTS